MRYLDITYPDVNNGEGTRVTLWVAGCLHHCPGCHNPESWDINGGKEFEESDKNKLFSELSNPYIDGFTISGGEPLMYKNELIELLNDLKTSFPDLNIWIYTGYTLYLDYIKHYYDLFRNIDVVVDGHYIKDLRDTSLAFRGSSNQRLIDIKKSLNENKLIEYEKSLY